MCGIAAIVGRRPVSSAEGWAMADALQHRGPDGQGVAVFASGTATVQRSSSEDPAYGAVVFGHTRLSVIDLSPAGFQPMADEYGRYWVVYNGEIYNFVQLRRELQACGHQFASRTDTEVLLHGWEEWGRDLLHRIEGMFAFCILDTQTEVVFVARDRLGVKPVYYATRFDGAVVIASEAKALFAAGITPEVDLQQLDAYLHWLWVPDPDTAFKGVYKLPPGHTMEIGRHAAPQIEAYWDIDLSPDELPRDRTEELREAVTQAVGRQMVSDAPIGAFFSGGVDSTAIVELMRRGDSSHQPSCFTIGLSEKDISYDVIGDDLKYARRYARSTGVEYHETILKPSLVDDLPAVVWHMDEPVADPAALSAFYISRAAKEHATVLLSGMGGDELFGGYPRYAATELARSYRRIPAPLKHAIGRVVDTLPGAGAGRMATAGRNAKKFLRGAASPFPEDYLSFLTHFDDRQRASLYTPDLRAEIRMDVSDARHRAHLARAGTLPWLHQVMYLDLKTYLPAHNLTYMDKMSMAHSIEARVPLLDERVVSVARHLPQAELMRRRETKIALKRSLSGIVPPDILRRRKAGFTAPIRSWLRSDLRTFVTDVLADGPIRARGLFEPSAVKGVIGDFWTGHRDTSLEIWQLLTFELWMSTFIDRRAPRPLS